MTRNLKAAYILIGSTIIIAAGIRNIRKDVKAERIKRTQVITEVGLDVAAIQNAADVVNARIERGEIRDYDELRDAVISEVSFQKIAIREELN